MSDSALFPRTPRSLRGGTSGLLQLLIGFGLIAAVWFGTEMAVSGHTRLVFAALIAGMLGILAIHSWRTAVLLLLVYLACMGEVRRLLLYITGWPSNDPLQLVAPAIALLLAFPLLMRRTAVPATNLSRLVLLLMGLMLLQVFNPSQGGLMVGIAGGFFYVIPLLWFWIGREFADEAFFDTLLFKVVPMVAVATAVMGIYQAVIGFLPHQQIWVDNYSYSAIMLAFDTARPFSTFTSGQEFAAYMVLAASVIFSLAVARGNYNNLILLPLFLAAAFIQGSRGPMLGFVQMLALIWAVHSPTPGNWLPRFGFAMVLGLSLGYLAVSRLAPPEISPAVSAAAQHQIEGLTDPLNEEKSTASAHVSMKLNGILAGVQQPWGYGLGATTLAAAKFGGNKFGTEIDVSNMFVSLGVVGGILYIVIIVWVTILALRHWAETRTATALAMGAVLACTLGQWISGGMYAIAPIIWLIIGRLDAASVTRHNEHDEDSLTDDEFDGS